MHQAVYQGPGQGGAVLVDDGKRDILGVQGQAKAEENIEN
jgi:hypothetical protein